MSAKRVCPTVMLLALLAGPVVRGQDTPPPMPDGPRKADPPVFSLMNVPIVNDPDQGPVDNSTQASIRNYHRIDATAFVGREWYLRGTVFDRAQGRMNWRVGADLGGAWGTSHVDLNDVT